MATSKECPQYEICGFIKWRRERPDLHILPLPENGDCGKVAKTCGRLDPDIPFEVEKYGPVSYSETEIGFPELPNNNNRPKRRLVGGGHL